jgi:hypothetical protein
VKATLVINAAYASAGRIQKVPWSDMVGIHHYVDYAAAQRQLFSELGGWGYATEQVEVDENFRFEGLADD